MRLHHAVLLSLALGVATAATSPDPRDAILIDDTGVFPENIAASRDGTIWFGSVAKGTIYRAPAGAGVAVPWIAGGTAGMRQAMGLWADDRRGLLWVCAPGARAKDGVPAEATAIKTFDLKTGAPRASYGFDGGGRCNDLTVSAKGIVYAGDFDGGRVMRLAPGDTRFSAWAIDPRLVSVDGLALLGDGQLYANTYRTNLLFRIPVGKDGAAGQPVPIATSIPLARPDGMRAVARHVLLLAEGDGRLSELTIAGDTATVRIVRDGLADSPAGVALVKGVAFVVQAKWAAMRDPAKDPGRFGAAGVPYPGTR